MIQLSVNKFRSNLKTFVDQSINDHIPLRVRRRIGRDFIVMSAEDWEREQETLYVLQNSSLMKQINESSKTYNSNSGYKPTEEELEKMHKTLKRRGKLYAGFGPLYKSPYGGHRRMKMPIPWGHLMLPESMLMKWVSMRRKEKINSVRDLGLNKMSLADYKRLSNKMEWTILYFKVNHGDRLMSKIFSWISKISFMEEYFSHDLYCVLKRDD